ncbi:MAG: magnesium transporter [Lysobacteraceae bacterium]|nr:MAG: magnesium transporter [Xanthomonadaceae bacterium]
MPADTDPDSHPPQRSWFDRISQALSGEPRNREELLEELQAAHANGLLGADTLQMIEGAIRVADMQVGDVMVPRAQMVSVPIDASLQEILEIVVESGHSRFPVHGEDKDEIVGILLAKDLLREFAGKERRPLGQLLRPAVLIPESKRLNVLLREFRQNRNHMAIVVDEYGGVAGLVTIEDVLEEIVGEIDDEHDEERDDAALIRPEPDGGFHVDALTPIAEFNEHFGASLPDDDYDTIGGLVVDAMGHLPEVGEELDLDRFHFRVTAVEARRVRSLHVKTGTTRHA